MDCTDEQWEIRWEAAELVIRTVKRLNAADDDDEHDRLAALDFPGKDDDDEEYSPSESAKRRARKKRSNDKKKAAESKPKAAEPADKDFHIAYTDLACLGVPLPLFCPTVEVSEHSEWRAGSLTCE
jgi:hypothetical protein